MGRKGFSTPLKFIRGAWSAREDEILVNYIKIHGEGKWPDLARRSGLRRCGKSCRLRWLNYLRPGIKRGNFSEDEDDLIIRLHKLLGNRWTLIAGRLPDRTDNEIKNYWNTNLSKRVEAHNKISEELIKATQNQEINSQINHKVMSKELMEYQPQYYLNIKDTNHSLKDDHNHKSTGFSMDLEIDIVDILSPNQQKENSSDNCYAVKTINDTDHSFKDEATNYSAVAEPLQDNYYWDLEAVPSFLCSEDVIR